MDHVVGILNESWVLLAKMAPYLLLGVVVAGAMHVILPEGLIARYLGKPGLGSVVRSTALGVPLPLCSCGVVPVAASLKKEGASSGAVVGFLVSTPTSGVDSILATYALIGGAYAVIRVIGSFVLGIAAGAAANFVARDGRLVTPPTSASTPEGAGRKGNPVADGFAYGFGEMLGAIARPLAIGILLGGAITYFVPASFVTRYVGTGIWSYLVMLAVGLPLYVCASGSIPLAAAFMALGISPGAALIFLIVGPATNAATFTVVLEMLGRRVLIIYLAVLSLGALAMGAATDAFFTTVPSLLPAIATGAKHHAEHLGWLEISTAVILGAATLYHLGRQLKAVIDRRKAPAADAFVLRVPDMSCQHCAGTITKAVVDLPGVVTINADPGTKLVTLDLGQNADTDGLVKAIEAAGFHPEKA
jgi:uncharacterized membrane protein YraQ (UPF0718 family)/copper chaperone CopZ